MNRYVFFSSLLAFSSTLFLSKVSQFSPVYVIGTFLVFSFFIIFYAEKFNTNTYINISFITAFYFALSQIALATPAAYVNLILGLLMGIVFSLSAQQVPLEKSKSVVKFFITSTLLVISADSFYRLSNPGLPSDSYMDEGTLIENGGEFYLYKFNSLMFADSNSTALVLICLFFVTYYATNLKLLPKRFGFIILSIIYILVILTFSRAAFISLTFVLILKKLYNRYFLIFLAPASLISIITLFSVLQGDGSLATKFMVVEKTLFVIGTSDVFQILFGYGFDRTREVFGFTAHNLFIEYLLGSGVIGFLFFILYWFFIFKLLPAEGKLLVVTVSIASMSYFLYAGAPFLFVSFSIFYWLQNLKERVEFKEFVNSG